MSKTYLKPILFGLILLIGISVYQFQSFAIEGEETNTKKILYVNAYHEGYKWSDDIYEATLAYFDNAGVDVEFDVYYLDSRRVLTENLEENQEYFISIARVIQLKSEKTEYDLIMTSDDGAYQFINNYCGFLDSDIPLVFSGLNNIESLEEEISRPKGGVTEYLDVEDTLQLIKDTHKQVTKVYYVNDDTLTGKAIELTLLEAFDKNQDFEFIKLDGDDLEAIVKKASKLDKDSVILFGIYFYDRRGDYFEYDEVVKLLSDSSEVPIYGLWEFHMNHGIIGGKLISGINQGQSASEIALDYLLNGYEGLRIIHSNQNQYQFDYGQLVKHEIIIESLPENADLLNYNTSNNKNVLILHSYNSEFQWTNTIHEGMMDVLDDYEGELEIYTEYMDLKRVSDPLYNYHYKTIFKQRHGNREFDLILTSDDGAFNFAKEHLKEDDTPIVFCGVNYLESKEINEHPNYSGVMEAYDIKGTIDSITQLQPNTKNVYVINDYSVTGAGNKRNVEAIESLYPDLKFSYTQDLSMDELQNEVISLSEDSVVLLMTFNRDRSNNTFSYEQSINMLYGYSPVSMYSVWDFYLGSGIVGGYLTSGRAQGYESANIGLRVLEGEEASTIPIVTFSPNEYKFDKEQLEHFNISEKLLPKGSILINSDDTFMDIYRRDPRLFHMIFTFMIFGIVIIVILFYYLRKSVRLHNQVLEMAENDLMTGFYNRNTGINKLEILVKTKDVNQQIYIHFVDLNELKKVNDLYGHNEGDQFIMKVVDCIRQVTDTKDILCRMGGDEFMVVTTREEYHDKAFNNSLKKLLEKESNLSKKAYDYAVSIGDYCPSSRDEVDVSKLIEAADKKMYEDKENYRKRRKDV